MLAVAAFHQGNYREAANNYLAAFDISPSKWDLNRWQIFHGCTSILQESYFQPSEEDMKALIRIGKNKHEMVLYRVEASFTVGILSFDRGNREDAAELYRSAMRIAKKATEKERKRTVLSTITGGPNNNSITGFGPTPVGDLLDDISQRAERNLARMESIAVADITDPLPALQPTMRSNGTLQPPSRRDSPIAVGPNPATFTREQAGHLLSVGGSRCDNCNKTASEVSLKQLKKCSRCGRGFYCSAACQKDRWKDGHKLYCRKLNEFKIGDYVRLHGLVSKPEMNGTLVELLDVDPNNPETRWKVAIPGGNKSVSIASDKMEHLRPLK